MNAPFMGDLAAALPWPTFPCNSDKKPIMPRGFKTAEKERMKVRALFAHKGAALIGVPTGAPSGIVAIDIDVKPGSDGRPWLVANQAALPPTRTHQTRSGGMHLLFKAPPGVEIRNSASKIAAGVDVRGEGGYIIVPPSAGYTVTDPTDLADLPAFLIEQCVSRKATAKPVQRPEARHERYTQAAIDGEVLAVTRAGEGTRNDTLHKAAVKLGTLVGGGHMTRGNAEAELHRAGNMTGLPTNEVEATVKSGLDYGERNPRQMPNGRDYYPEPDVGADDAAKPPPDWMAQLVRKGGKEDRPGVVIPTVANALILIAHDDHLSGLMAYNKFTETSLIMRAPPIAGLGEPPLPGPYPRAWQHEDVTSVLAYMQRLWNTEFSARTVESSMAHQAMTRPFHPVVQWLDGLQWDGKNRLFRWLISAFGTEKSEYVNSVGAKTLIAAVRRVRQPGCKFDTMLILEGPQGIKKSTALQALFSPEWFSDATVPDLGSKDAAMCLHGAWCLEFAEIAQLMRSEVETIKGFLSRAVDRYRPPYAKNTVEKPRQGILIGTTNEQGFLRDASGNRRFWPVECVMANLKWIEENRDQLWAEACHYEANGETIWLDDAIIEAQAMVAQAERVATDPWDDKVSDYIQGKEDDGVKVADILKECLYIDTPFQDLRAARRLASILRRLGWGKCRRMTDGVQSKAWRPICPHG